MHEEEQQIHDSPQQLTVIKNNNKPALELKQSLLQSLTVLTDKSPSTMKLSQCHKAIAELMKQAEILSALFGLLEQSNGQNDTLSKLIVTQVFTYMKRQMSFGYDQRHNRVQIMNSFVQMFLHSSIDFKYKKMLQKTFMQFIYHAHNIKLRQSLCHTIDQLLTSILSSTPLSLLQLSNYQKLSSPVTLFLPPFDIITPETYTLSLQLTHLYRCLLMGGNLQVQLMKQVLPGGFSIYFRVAVEVVKVVMRAVEKKEEAVFVEKVEDCARVVEVLALMYARLDSGKWPLLKAQLMHTEQWHQLFLVMMNLSPAFGWSELVVNMLEQSTFIGSTSSHQKRINQLIVQLKFGQNLLAFFNLGMLKNENLSNNDELTTKKLMFSLITIKKSALEVMIKGVKTLQKRKDKAPQEYPYLHKLIAEMWTVIKTCLIKETQHYLKQCFRLANNSPPPTASSQQLPLSYQSLISTSITFLTHVTRTPSLYSLVCLETNQLLFTLCLPWLISRPEHQRFQAEDYLFFREDIVNKQNMSYVENAVGGLVEAYLDNVDGVVSGIMAGGLSIVGFLVTGDERLLDGLEIQVKNSWVIQFYPKASVIEAVLTLVSIQSYLSLRRNDIALQLQQFIIHHSQFFLSLQNDGRITTQFLLMYSYYVDNFYLNLLQGLTPANYRQFHRQVLKYCCYLMKHSYDYENNRYRSKQTHILYLSALDCLNNSLNHTEIVPVLYTQYPNITELNVPKYMLPYENYPFYPARGKRSQPQKIEEYDPRKQKQEDISDKMKLLLTHYTKLGLNTEKYINATQLLQITNFLTQQFTTKSNIKILELLTEVLLSYVKGEFRSQGSLMNIPVVFRQQMPMMLAQKIYAFFLESKQKVPNRSLFYCKLTELLYVTHAIAVDPYVVFEIGLDVVWGNANLWNFDPQEDDNNVDQLLKCMDLIVRLRSKHYQSQKGVNLKELMQKISTIIIQYSYLYITKLQKFNILFGIILNLILLKTNPQQLYQYLFVMITQKLFKSQLQSSSQQEQPSKIASLTATELLSQAFYLFLVNVYRNPQYLTTDKVVKLLEVFMAYLKHYTNAHDIVTQLGDVFGKVFACCLSMMEGEYLKGTLIKIDQNMVAWMFRNVLYSGKIYKTELEYRVVAIKLLKIVRQAIRRNDETFTLERVSLMYQTACQCVYYAKNKDLLIEDDQEECEPFQHAGEQEEWENQAITLNHNDVYIYLEDQVNLLKLVSRQLLQSQNTQIKLWVTKLIESLPVAVKNFVKNKVLNYEREAKEVGLRKIVKVKRQGNAENQNGITKREIIKQNQAQSKENDENQEH